MQQAGRLCHSTGEPHQEFVAVACRFVACAWFTTLHDTWTIMFKVSCGRCHCRFVQVVCPEGEQICRDEEDSSHVWCSTGGICAAALSPQPQQAAEVRQGETDTPNKVLQYVYNMNHKLVQPLHNCQLSYACACRRKPSSFRSGGPAAVGACCA